MFKQSIRLLSVTLILTFASTALAFDVPLSAQAPVLDGQPSDAGWKLAEWQTMDHLMWGTLPEKEDFSGRYKLIWAQNKLYLLAEIIDDVLFDSHPDPLDQYWEDDALEIFIDADASGGDHLLNYNAFAFHISLDNQAADMGPYLTEADRTAEKTHVRMFPDLIKSVWQRSAGDPHAVYWEVEITPVGDDYQDSSPEAQAAIQAIDLQAGMKMGFMLAYCDSDGELSNRGREHFMGDVEVEPVDGDRNLGYKTASVFGEITLVE